MSELIVIELIRTYGHGGIASVGVAAGVSVTLNIPEIRQPPAALRLRLVASARSWAHLSEPFC
ncbi:MAG: hypothetical protein U0X92_09920 [Anaerolineales bacterium]